MLECCEPIEEIRRVGVTIRNLGCIASCNGLEVKIGETETHSFEDFKADVKKASEVMRTCEMIVNYGRKALG